MGLTRRLHRAVVLAWRRQLDEDEEPFKAVIVLTIAIMTFLTAGLAALQVDAGARSATAGRSADTIGATATEQGTGALIQTQSDLGVYRRYVELLFDASWARRMAEAAPRPEPGTAVNVDTPSPALAAELAAIDAELAEWARSQSPLLLPPYWSETRAETDIGTFDAERNVGPQARMTLERRVATTTADSWGRRASDYVTTVTVVAVGLFFLGLAAALGATARRILFVAGLASGVVALVVGAAITLRPLPAVPTDAVDGLVAAEMALTKAAWSASPERLEEADRQHFEDAIAAADRAVAAAPDFVPARLARAEARTRYASELLLARSADPEAAAPLLERALQDFEAVTVVDEDAYSAWWNFGWAAYLAGDPQLSIAATDRALALAPNQFALYLNRALARLSAGDGNGAMTDVTTAVDVAGRARLDSNGWFFSQTDYNLGRLAASRPAERQALLNMQRRLREAAVTMRIGRPADASASAIDTLEVRTLALDQRAQLVPGDIVDDGAVVSPTGVAGFRLRLAGAVDGGSMVSVRVRENGTEAPDVRFDAPWPAGAAEMTIDLVTPYGRMGADVDAAEHELEVYVDGRTRASVTFRVELPVEFTRTAAEYAELVTGSGLTCDPPRRTGEDRTITSCLTTGQSREVGTEVLILADGQDRIRRVTASSPTVGGLGVGLARELAGLLLGMALESSIADDARDWIDVAEPGTATTFSGIGFSISAADGRLVVTAEAP